MPEPGTGCRTDRRASAGWTGETPGVALAPRRLAMRPYSRVLAFLRAAAIAAALNAGGEVAAFAQAAPDNTAAPTDSDPTRPVLFSVRPEFLKAADGIWRM